MDTEQMIKLNDAELENLFLNVLKERNYRLEKNRRIENEM